MEVLGDDLPALLPGRDAREHKPRRRPGPCARVLTGCGQGRLDGRERAHENLHTARDRRDAGAAHVVGEQLVVQQTDRGELSVVGAHAVSIADRRQVAAVDAGEEAIRSAP